MRRLMLPLVIASCLLFQGCSSLSRTPAPSATPSSRTAMPPDTRQGTTAAATSVATSPTRGDSNAATTSLQTEGASVLDYGARADGLTPADDAFRKAIAASKASHIVFVPQG